jgi:hypothetical protein
MRSAFLEEMRHTVTGNDTTLGPEKIAKGVIHPVAKETITQYKQ